MANLYTNSIDQAIDSNGNVYPGAKRYFYDNGTTNLRTIWQDSGKSDEHANPVVADGAGVFPQIFIEGAYSTRLVTATDALIDTQDDVNVTITDILANQSTSGATLTNLDYDEASSSGLSFAYSSGRIDNEDGTVTAISAGSKTLAASQTNYIYLDYSTETVETQTSSGRVKSSLLYTVVTDGSSITSVTREKDAFRTPERFPTDYLDGLGISYNNATTVTIGAGNARDDSDSFDMVLGAFTKTTATFATGTGNGALLAGQSLTANTRYYVFVISKDDSAVDVFWTTDSTGASLPTVGGTWQYKVYIGSFSTNESDTDIDPDSFEVVTDSKITGILAGNSASKVGKKAIANDDIEAGSGTIVPIMFTRSTRGPDETTSVVAYTIICTTSGTYNYFARIERDSSNDSAFVRLDEQGGSTLVTFTESGTSGEQQGTVDLSAGTIYEIRIDENLTGGIFGPSVFYFNLGVSLQTAVGMGTVIAWQGINFEPDTNGIFIQ